MSDSKYTKENYGIYPMRSLSSYLGIIASIIGIGTAIYLLEGFWRILSIIGLIVVILLFFLIKVSLRLSTLLNSYNKMVDEINQANDNRQTLVKMVEEKNADIENLQKNLNTSVALMSFFVSIVYSGSELPDRKIVEDALLIEGKGDKDYEE